MSGFALGVFINHHFDGNVPLWVWVVLAAVIAISGVFAWRDYKMDKKRGL